MARRHQGPVKRTEYQPRKGSNHLQNFSISHHLFFEPLAFKAEIQDPHAGRGADVGHTASFLGLLGVLLASITLGGSCCGLLDFPMSAEKNSQCQSDVGCGHNPAALGFWKGSHGLEEPPTALSHQPVSGVVTRHMKST